MLAKCIFEFQQENEISPTEHIDTAYVCSSNSVS